MGWKQWLAVGLVIGGGILLQIPPHDPAGMDHEMSRGDMPTEMVEVEGPYRTVALEVMGMT